MGATTSSSSSGSIPCGWNSNVYEIWNSYRGHSFYQLGFDSNTDGSEVCFSYSGQKVLPSVQASICDHDVVQQGIQRASAGTTDSLASLELLSQQLCCYGALQTQYLQG
jgi:hypothetical protein